MNHPSKFSAKPKMPSAKEVSVVSNHYLVKMKNFSFNEFHIRFIRQADLVSLQSNPEFFDGEAVDSGARETIRQIVEANKAAIKREIGQFNVTGVTLFNFKKVQKKQFVFKEHSEFVLIVKLRNENVGSDKLVANEGCRKQVLRFLDTYAKQMMKNMQMVEFGRLKKYYNLDEEVKMDLGGIQISLYKGFKTAFEVYASGPRLVVNSVSRIVRSKSIYQEFMEQLRNFQDQESAAEELFIGKTGITTYGNPNLTSSSGLTSRERPPILSRTKTSRASPTTSKKSTMSGSLPRTSLWSTALEEFGSLIKVWWTKRSGYSRSC